MPEQKTFQGIVKSGRGLGALRMALPSVQEAVRRRLGLSLVPGTLNLHLPAPFNTPLPHYIGTDELGHDIPGVWYGEVLIAGRYSGFVIRGDEPGYPDNQVELVSDHHLRQALGLQDGDTLEFTLLG